MTKAKTTYEQMGMAALLPGMQHMLDLMQAELAHMRAALEARQEQVTERRSRSGLLSFRGVPRGTEEYRRIDRENKRRRRPVAGRGIKGYWEQFTPEERSRIMKARFQKRSKADKRKSIVAMQKGAARARKERAA